MKLMQDGLDDVTRAGRRLFRKKRTTTPSAHRIRRAPSRQLVRKNTNLPNSAGQSYGPLTPRLTLMLGSRARRPPIEEAPVFSNSWRCTTYTGDPLVTCCPDRPTRCGIRLPVHSTRTTRVG